MILSITINIKTYASRNGMHTFSQLWPHLWHPELQSPEEHYRYGSESLHLTGIYTYKKGRSTQFSKYSPWGTEVKPFLLLQKRMMEFLRWRQVITTPMPIGHTNPNLRHSSEIETPARRHNLVTLTQTQQREALSA